MVVGDRASGVETREVAAQVNALGRMDAVIHNAGVSSTKGRSPTPEGHATILAVNTLIELPGVPASLAPIDVSQ